MKVLVLMADKGTVNPQQGTLNLLNAGWTQTQLRPVGPMVPGGYLTPPHAVAAFFEVEPKYCNRPVDLVFELVDQDGHAVEVPAPAGPQPMRVTQQIFIQSHAGMPIGSPGIGNALIEIVPGLAIPPGGYQWRVELAGETSGDWSTSFRVSAILPPSGPIIGSRPSPPPDSGSDTQ
jgi:hypothetical protein